MKRGLRRLVHGRSNHPRVRYIHLAMVFTFVVSLVLALTLIIMAVGMLVLNAVGVIMLPDSSNIVVGVILWMLASLCVGVVTAAMVSHIPMRPFQCLIEGMNQLATGDYTARLHIGHSTIFKKLSDSFNALAVELENTEILRTDFVNNFSHEFKTPIVSILGFAKLLKRADIPADKREEYLDIIVDEARRLTDMSDHVLSLAKLKNRTFLPMS